jgi:hypothetical protein
MLRSTTMFAAVLLAIGCGTVPGNAAASPGTACKAAGLNPGEATFADCVRVLGAQTPPFRAVDDNTARAQQSCALIGYAVDSEQFSSCVANVMQTLFDRSGPQS